MENDYFIFSDSHKIIELERLHICTWEFNDNSSLIEIGCEICLQPDNYYVINSLSICFFIPWLTETNNVQDLYENLNDAENCKFIFNDPITATEQLGNGNGIIQKFQDRDELCILPISNFSRERSILKVELDFRPIRRKDRDIIPRIYFRFMINSMLENISTRKNGIGKSTIIYDFKINEKRNLPPKVIDFEKSSFVKIKNCFIFHIIPNSYDITFLESQILKNIRTLEFNSFKKYLNDDRITSDDYVVIFLKKVSGSFGFFTVFNKERIGLGQFALAILANMFCGFLLFLPTYRENLKYPFFSLSLWRNLPLEIYLSLSIELLIFWYFYKLFKNTR